MNCPNCDESMKYEGRLGMRETWMCLSKGNCYVDKIKIETRREVEN